MTHAPLDYNEIVDGIYIGSNQCCQVHFEKELSAKGITADISLEFERMDIPFGVDFYLWIPVPDHHAPHHDQLVLGVEVLKVLVKMKRKVYVHCKNGHGRSPTLVAAYLIRKGMSESEAHRLLMKARPSIHLTKEQQEALHAWEKESRTKAMKIHD